MKVKVVWWKPDPPIPWMNEVSINEVKNFSSFYTMATLKHFRHYNGGVSMFPA